MIMEDFVIVQRLKVFASTISLPKKRFLSKKLLYPLMSLVTSSSSSDPSKRQFDVFVSFRGADTRNTFTSYLLEFLLRKGIDAFFDGKLRRGKDISVLFDRIEQSKMSIIVFSENYANSTWCLEELWKIMQCREKFGHGVLPVFYKVKKSDVENQRGSFEAPFLSPKESFKGDVHKVGAWKEALKIASNILGYVLPEDRPEIEFVEKIAKETFRMLNDLSPCEISGFPGIEPRSKELEELLMFDNKNCIRTIGVFGMTGIGKTTVADSVYKRNYRQFDGYCFLEDIQNESERHGLHHLHQKLLCKLLDEENVDVRAHGRLKDFLRNKKLFIVLDNVTDVNQIEVLIGQKKLYRNGSRIIITTRDKKVLQNYVDAAYVVPRLNDREAMELFCLDAFSDLYPTEEFLDLSNNFVYYAKGHPLALKLLGSGLRQKERTYWVEKWERLTVMPDNEIQKVLKMSYEALDDEQKIIFLHIKNESERHGSEAGRNLIGIKFLLERILPLIHCHQPSAPQIVGLWGMAGIGKTAITREIYRMEAQRYDLSYFLPDFHLMCQTKGLSHLRDDFFSKIFGEEKVFIDAYDTTISFTRNRFLDKKILIVLDGVSNVRDAEVLVGGFGWFSGGHTIILTSRNRQVLVQCKAKELYKIPRLSKEESLRLCYQIVTEQKWRGWMSLISVLVTYAGGIPLALRVLGLSVQKQRINVEKQHLRILHQHLRRLRQHPPIEIQDAFRNSFNGLHDNEKNIFLDLACFFRGEDKDHVVNILDGCGFFTDFGICALTDESLISLVDNKLQMPNIFQDMGRFVVCQEYEAAGKRTRLWDSNDIVDVLSNKTGTEAVEGIFLDMSGLSLELSPTVFERMYRLRLLKLHCPISENHCKVCLPQGLHSLPDELRLLHWERYPLEFLPRNFNPKNLVELKMPYSNIKRLWKGTKNLEKLKRIILSYSPLLTTFPRLSKARNLEHIDLEGCVNLVKVNSSILHNHKLTFLSLKGCSHLQIMPPTVHLESLEVLNLSGCSELENLHDFSPNLKELYLAETAIREMPSSIGDLTRLVTLDLENCERLQHLPPRISNLKAMVTLNLSGCSNLKSLPNLDALFLSDSQRLNTMITKEEFVPFKLHSAIQESRLDGSEIFLNFDNLQLRRDIHGSCFSRDAEDKFLPAFKYLISHNIPQESWPRVAITLLPSSIVHSLASRLYALVSLFLCNTDLVDIPEELSWLASVKTLDLGGNSFSQIPKSIKELHKLHNFRLRHCKNLISLPELPRSLEILNAHGCLSLESFPLDFEQFPRHYTFSNCFNLSPEVVREFIRKVQYSAEGMAKGHQLELSNAPTFSICIPASAGHKSSVNFQAGSSVMTELTPGTLKTLSGFVLSVVVEFCDNYRNAAGFGIKCIWRKARPDPSPRLERIFHCWAPKEAPTVQKDHMFVFGVTKMHPADGIDHGFLADLFTFEFHPVNWQNKLLDDSCSVKRCGVYLTTAATCDRTHSAKRPSSLMNPGELSSVEHMAPPYKRCCLKRVIESVILSLRKRKREKSASRTTNLAKVQLGSVSPWGNDASFWGLRTRDVYPERPGQPDCQYYMRTGDCKFGNDCQFHHPRDRATSSCKSSLIP